MTDEPKKDFVFCLRGDDRDFIIPFYLVDLIKGLAKHYGDTDVDVLFNPNNPKTEYGEHWIWIEVAGKKKKEEQDEKQD